MIKLQQFSFVCAPSMVQHAGVAAWDYDVSAIVADYRRKRDRIYQGLKDRYELVRPEGRFLLFPERPTAREPSSSPRRSATICCHPWQRLQPPATPIFV